MSSYPYDSILTPHFQKNAGFLAPLARTAWSGAKELAVGQAGQVAIQFHNHASSNASAGPSFFGWWPGAKQGSLSSPREKQAAATYRLKSANDDHTPLHYALHAAPYVAWLGSQAADATGHPTLSKALSAGAYLGYAGASAHDAFTGKTPTDRGAGAIDALALTAMLGSDIARWRQAPSTPTH